VQAAAPVSKISIGRIAMLRPPLSGSPSITTAWPLPDSPTKLTPSIHLMRVFIAIQWFTLIVDAHVAKRNESVFLMLQCGKCDCVLRRNMRRS
jgi:hypothetical protein